MSTDTLTADHLSQLLSRCREMAALCASAWITGTHSLGEIYEEIESWYDRYRDGNLPLPQYQDLPSPVQDQLFDAWIEGVEGYFAKRASGSDSEACAASSPPQPLHATDPVKASPEGSVCEVELLGDVMPTLEEIMEMANNELRKIGIEDRFVPGFMSGWLRRTENFPSPDQSSLLREVREAILPFAHKDLSERAPSMPMGDDSPVYGRNKALLHLGDFRMAVAVLTKLNTALGEEQKGGATKDSLPADH